MANLDTALNVKFNGEASGVISEADRAARSVKKLGTATEKQTSKGSKGAKQVATAFLNVGKAAAKAAAAMAATAGVAFTALVKEGLAAGDALAKTADSIGIATDQLAKLRLAAGQTGVEISQFDKGLQRLLRNVAEASTGTGEAVDAFNALGVSAQDLVKHSPDKQFGIISDALNRVQNSTQKVQLAYEIFGRAGISLINTARLGSAGLDEFGKKAETLGIALTREAAANIERANDAVDLLKKGISGLGQQLAARSAPFIEAIADKGFAAIEAIGGMGAVAELVITNLVEGFATVSNTLHAVNLVITGMKAVFQEVGRAILNIARMINVSFVTVGNVLIDLKNTIIEAFVTALSFLLEKFTSFANSVANTYFLPDALQERARNLAGFTQQLADGFADTAANSKIARMETSKFLDSVTEKAHALATEYKQNFLDLLDSPPPGDEIRRWFDRVKDQAAEMSNDFVSSLGKIGENADITADQVADSFTAAAKTSKTAWQSFGEDLRSAFIDVFKSGSDALDNFVDRIKTSFKEAGLRQLFDGTVGKAFAGGAGGLSSIFSAAGGAGGAGAGGFGLVDGLGAAGGIKSLLSTTAGGALGSLGATLLGGIDGFAKVIASTFGEGAVSNAVSSAYSSIFNTTSSAGEMLGLTGDSAFGAGALMSLAAGIAGNFAGNALGEGIFGKEAESSIGATAGGLIGSFFGPIGSFLGSTLGSLVDVAFGGDGKKRNNAGVIVGNDQITGDRFGDFVTGESGLTFQSFTRRSDKEVSEKFTSALVGIDSLLTTISRSAGLDVDLSGRNDLGVIRDAGHSGPGAFFGAKGFNGGGSLEGQAEAFVSAWLEQIEAQLPLRVAALNRSITGTAEEMVRAFEAGIRLDALTSVSVFDEVNKLFDVLADLEKPSKTLHEIYEELTEQTFEATEAFDGSGEAMGALADSLTQQKTIALQLVAAYRAVSIEIDSLLGSTIQSIRESVLSDEQIYAARRAEIASLTSQLSSAISPEEINRLVSEIDALTNQAYSLLDETQKQQLSAEFISFLTEVQDRAQAQIDAALVGIQENDEALNTQIATAVFDDAVTRFGNAVDRFNDQNESSAGTRTIVVNIPGLGFVEIPDLTDSDAVAGPIEIGF